MLATLTLIADQAMPSCTGLRRAVSYADGAPELNIGRRVMAGVDNPTWIENAFFGVRPWVSIVKKKQP